MLEEALRAAGEDVVLSKEPTDGQWGAKLRASANLGRLPFDEELEAFLNDRQEHLESKVIPALEAGKIVILDRYFYSTIAYQGIRCQNVPELAAQVRADVVTPDAAFFLELAPQIAAYRIERRDGEANHFEGIDDLVKIDAVFQSIADNDRVFQRVDGVRSKEDVHCDVLSRLVSGALKRKRCAKHYGCDDPVMCGYRMTSTCAWWLIAKKLMDRTPGLKLAV